MQAGTCRGLSNADRGTGCGQVSLAGNLSSRGAASQSRRGWAAKPGRGSRFRRATGRSRPRLLGTGRSHLACVGFECPCTLSHTGRQFFSPPLDHTKPFLVTCSYGDGAQKRKEVLHTHGPSRSRSWKKLGKTRGAEAEMRLAAQLYPARTTRGLRATNARKGFCWKLCYSGIYKRDRNMAVSWWPRENAFARHAVSSSVAVGGSVGGVVEL